MNSSENRVLATVSVEQKVIKGAVWLATFKFLSQIFSWAITITIARILNPGDYGLMAMATIITGYAEMFSRLGLGAAIIQRPNSTQAELSSVFWLTLFISTFFTIGCLMCHYLKAENCFS